METITCPTCGVEYPDLPDHFRYRDGKRHGRQCNQCRRAKAKEHYRKNAERIREYNRTNAERMAAYQKRYYQEHCTERSAYDKQYRQEHRAEYTERARQWKESNPERSRENDRIGQHRRRTRKLACGGSHTRDELREQRASQDDCCAYCGVDLSGAGHLEHMTPLSRGGSNGIENILLACPSCNLTKAAHTAEEFLELLFISGKDESCSEPYSVFSAFTSGGFRTLPTLVNVFTAEL